MTLIAYPGFHGTGGNSILFYIAVGFLVAVVLFCIGCMVWCIQLGRKGGR